MDKQDSIIAKLKQQVVLPLFYHGNAGTCLETTRALYAAGIRAIEFTNRGGEALANFRAMAEARDQSMKDLLLAAGTIRSADQANRFIEAGADFLVSPVFDADVCDTAYINKVLWIPGCMTPTEIHVAAQAGCRLIKLFPGHVLGPAFVSSVRELFPGLDFMPTGGVEPTRESIEAWLNAGACAAGLGSKLIPPALLDNRNFRAIEAGTKELLRAVAQLKK